MTKGRLFLWAASMTAAAAILPPLCMILGYDLAGRAWNALRLTAPWLSEAGLLCAGALGGLLLGALQWAQLRPFRARVPVQLVPGPHPRAGARWIGASVTAGLAVGLASALYQPSALLAAPLCAGLAGVVQARLLPRPDLRWVRAQSLSAAFVALSLLGVFPHWSAAGFLLGAGVLSAWGIRAATSSALSSH